MIRTLALALVALALPATTPRAQAWDFTATPRVSLRTFGPRVLLRPRVVARPRLATPPAAETAASTGSLRCAATRNGTESRARLELLRAGRPVASAPCGLGAAPLSAAAGAYIARVTLEGTLDATHRDVPVNVIAGQLRGLTVEVPTALLEVRAEVNGRRVFGRAIVRRGGLEVGSLGSGVVATLSPGRYDIEVRRGAERRLLRGVELSRGQRRALRVAF